ncbi:hypothetical protein N8I77_011482 [Diaporthe amygdali]|uniref:Uncharacterized protein n=1 Tax=Phomopsis amygdali TaxID=1214568 RepID=A0AAD9S6Z8_PHOAM|nr:hypothetical protein N8I77_011482 [Diaporthe amygdali]
MHLKLITVIYATWGLSLRSALAQDDGSCYDSEQHPVEFADLGSRQEISQALNETCEPPLGDQVYQCNTAKALNVHMPNNASRSFVFHFASLRYVNQSTPDSGPCGDVYFSRESCVYLGLTAMSTCEHGGELTINETEAAGGGEQKPVTAWLQVIPYI